MANEELKQLDKFKHSKLIDLLNGVRSIEINGKQIIQTQEGEFIEHVLMDEQYFIDNWLAQFALGNVSGKNYFNQNEWNRLTDGYTKGVIVLNAEKEPVLVIRKFIDMDLNVNQQQYFETYTRGVASYAYCQNKDEINQVVESLANVLSQVAEQNPEYDTLTAMIPYEYYLSKGIDPTVVKQVIYIRDNYNYQGKPIDPDGELITKIEKILYKNARQESISIDEIKLINEITNGDFIFNETVNKVGSNNSQTQHEKPFNPFSD